MSADLPTDRANNVMSSLRNNRLIAAAIVVGALFTGLAQFSDSLEKLLVRLGVHPDALSLTRESQRDDVSRQLTSQAWRRFFWARAYLARVERDASQSEQDDAWHKYVEASAEWSSNFMIFVLAVDKFYGRGKSLELENDLQKALSAMAEKLIAVRYRQGSSPAEQRNAILSIARAAVDAANQGFYTFVSGFQPGAR
ncbi:hypothetical protein [Cupriavidus consociatus]|uniref:hypothetical protein n=1 Tax=Cupriavidus consociatus TaxID=2821357 RepID=UPI001AE811F0|nr:MULTISPECIES: hypothetical protein [unclassified Cupriavidus]MBP0624986.1 hypothetical protein [Cupriavidus sp. LEh25]MDK2661719.1 hypothetical protein [Cupriavidus sp. LEh21]